MDRPIDYSIGTRTHSKAAPDLTLNFVIENRFILVYREIHVPSKMAEIHQISMQLGSP